MHCRKSIIYKKKGEYIILKIFLSITKNEEYKQKAFLHSVYNNPYLYWNNKCTTIMPYKQVP